MTESFVNRIHWLGHDAFRIDGDLTIYFDPYEISGGKPADVIFITHDHFDHCSPDDVAKIQTEQTLIVTEKDSALKLSGNIRVVKPGDRLEEKGLTIEAVPAYNIDKDFHPKENGWLGVVVEIDGIKVYHAGDTDLIEEMKDIQTDIALLPVSGTYVMTADQAVEAALRIKPQIAIPMHYGSVVGTESDAEKFKADLVGKVDVHTLQKTAG